MLIGKGEEGKLISYYKPEEEGNFTIKGQVFYEGKRSDSKEITFSVVGGGAINPSGKIAENAAKLTRVNTSFGENTS